MHQCQLNKVYYIYFVDATLRKISRKKKKVKIMSEPKHQKKKRRKMHHSNKSVSCRHAKYIK